MRVIGGLLLIPVLLAVAVRLAALQGIVRPVRIVGGSMADALRGSHYSVRCADCGIEFGCGAEFPPANDLAVCPNCGYGENRVEETSLMPGRRVLIDRWRKPFHAQRLWQIMAYAAPDDTEFLAVKRVVAGGGGCVEIRDGDVLVDGSVQRKTLAQLRELCLLVHDDRFRPSRGAVLPARWRAASTESPWRATRAGYQYAAPPRASASEVEWLEYTQWVCWPGASPPAPRTTPTLIFDHDAYNQSLARGGLHQVTDVLLQCDTTLSGAGRLLLSIRAGGDSFQLELTCPQEELRLIHNGQTVWQRHDHRLRQTRDPRSYGLEFALCDQQVLAAINGIPVLTHAFEPNTREPAKPTSLAIGAAGVDVRLEAPRIYRDLHYRGPAGQRRWKCPQPLTPHQWFVLGDNVPISIDSRRTGPLDRDTFLGPVYRLSR